MKNLGFLFKTLKFLKKKRVFKKNYFPNLGKPEKFLIFKKKTKNFFFFFWGKI
ncbi:hypothetical protein EBI_25630 [Enterocytozoon bieneusi H348]|nr:hypothetical protein EBI_25630 [Enterocytozoon bieneusi H348]|eukprot:XP_002650762.1 hypothetical protein EBI_25630 [Enterocytozoon bieneusi H348]